MAENDTFPAIKKGFWGASKGAPNSGASTSSGGSEPVVDKGAQARLRKSGQPRFSYTDYAKALSALRRAGLTPTLSAVTQEVERAKVGRPEGSQPQCEPSKVGLLGGGDPTKRGGSPQAGELDVANLQALHSKALERVQALEAELEEARVDSVLTDSLEDLIQEQKLSLEATGQRVESLTVMLREASAKASRVDGLESSLVALQAELEAFRGRERRLQASLAEQQTSRHELEAKLEEVWSGRAENGTPSAEEQALLAELKTLTSSKQELEAELVQLRTDKEAHQAREETLTNQTAHLKAELEGLRYQLVESGEALEAARLLERQLAGQLDAARTSQAQTEAAHQQQEAEISTLSETIEKLTGQIESVTQVSEAQNRELAEALQKRSEAEAALAVAREQAAGFEKDLAGLLDERDQLVGGRTTLQARVAELEGRHLQWEEQLNVSESEIRSFKTGLAALESERTRWQSRAADLERDLVEAGDRLESAQTKIAALEQETQILEEALRSAHNETSAAREAASDAVESAQGALQRAASDRDRLSASLTAAESRATESDSKLTRATSDWAAKFADQASALRELREKNLALEGQLDESLSLRSDLAAAEAATSDLREKLADQTRLLDDWREAEISLRKQLGAASATAAEAESLRTQLDDHRTALEEARSANRSLSDRLERMAESLEQAASHPTRFPVRSFALAALLTLALVGAAGFAAWKTLPSILPQVEELQKNAEALDTLKTQNNALATELNETLARLQRAKETEISAERMRELTSRLSLAEASVGGIRARSSGNPRPPDQAPVRPRPGTQPPGEVVCRTRFQRL